MSNCYTSSEFVALTGTEFTSWFATNTATITWLGTGTAGDTITIGGITLTAVVGARAAGSLTWSIDGDVSTEIASFIAAIADSSLTTLVTASVVTPGTSVVTITSIATGIAGAMPISTSAPLVYELSSSTMSGWDTAINNVLITACSMIGDCWGTKALPAHLYLSAHILAVSGGGELGAVTNRAIDRISTGYASVTFDSSDAAFAMTRWGRLYLMLRGTVPVIGLVGSTDCIGVVVGGGCGC